MTIYIVFYRDPLTGEYTVGNAYFDKRQAESELWKYRGDGEILFRQVL